MPPLAADDITIEDLAAVDPWVWVNQGINLQSGPYSFENHAYQVGPMQSTARKRVYKKGAQMGFTEIEVLRTLHGMIHRHYPAGVLYLFPTTNDVSDFSKGRFTPLITENYDRIGVHVKDTDATGIKRIGNAMLYLRGARSTSKIEGLKKDASKLRTIPVDKVVYDERDLMAHEMVTMALERMEHSMVKEEVHISTPSIPDYGIDAEYQDSDQRVWFIRCSSCNHENCLELTFPECVRRGAGGRWIRACVKCGQELNPQKGYWVPQFPGRETEGYWISQLNSMYVDPGKLLELYRNPPNGNLQEVMNSKLAMAYVSAENRLTPNDLWVLCGQDPMPIEHEGPTAMGVDVGNNFHVSIVDRPHEKITRLVKACYLDTKKMTDFTPLHDLIKQYNVKSCVIDFAPVQQAVRSFREAEGRAEVFGCIYQKHQRGPAMWDVEQGIVRINRTEVCDSVHEMVTARGRFQMPRRSPDAEEFVKQMCNLVKVLEDDEETGSREYVYRKVGPDHYRHSMNYATLAAQRIGIYSGKSNAGDWRKKVDKGSWRAR
jgi:hypothetical protein